MKGLAVFDFDHTIIEDNTDTAVAALIPGEIPPKLKELHRKDGWTAFMQGVFDILHANNITKETITDVITKLKPINGMTTLIKELATNLNHDVIIISDSNSYFIESWLKNCNLKEYVLKVFTNPGDFVDGALKIQMYHLQDSCDLSTKNLCKGQILEDFIKSQKGKDIEYDRVIYSGDGSNDFCPILRLNPCDCAFVRDNYKCLDLVRKSENQEIKDKHGNPLIVKAKVYVWKNGYDILEDLKALQES
ncbi:hypothetical protein HHI36_006741 [Cryptolaemus montrouzieri]|uniref:Pyridoxal phosphate phosphatase PHOSPHO2 n=1 Tax=Cryptolaemus montrouzieri TaxID=559131 RepID=A0ABD2NY02_9CUCU